ncbi:DUF1554 domain-containing protein [Leptospira kemamanensis]|uniref:DUF1554 domain-containing protein n=1 Tax=Leptospira kemamanensis TaxID=2484942 RepID=A0A4R9JX66_9LEPT|nr:DUF1554 domain-containing protein [Leptospira kemamanensis]TGL56056.1 DUF1554 domain-containing protein [Leptospira kemamanensis]
MRWNGVLAFLCSLSFLTCNPVNTKDEFLFTLLNSQFPTTSFSIGSSAKINVTGTSVVLYYGTSKTFGFSLVRQPTANVVLSFTNAKLNVIGNLTFTSSDFNTVQLITLNSNTQVLETSNLLVTAASADPFFDGVSGQIPIYHRNVSVSYSGNSFIFKEDSAAPTLTATLGFPITNCSVAPALPNGLSINSSTCAISGTPTDQQAGTTYIITATDGTNTDTENITIRIEPTVYKVFITASTFDGNLQGAAANGPAGADEKCAADANKPSSGTYKAMVTDGANRRACSSPNCGGGVGENIDWIFQSGRIYIRSSDSASLFTPNAAGIINAPATILNHSFDSGVTKYYWTGFAQTNYWEEATFQTTNSCINWTTNATTPTASEGGRVGASNVTDYTAFRSGNGRSCSDSYHLVCVEQ